jgi:acylphosphatase
VTDGSSDRRLDVTVVGRVQGVGFRMFAFDRARALQLQGWVANESGGSVRVVAEGSEADLLRLLAAVREGPAGGRVDDVRESWSDATGGLPPFSIRSGSHSGD